MRARLAVLVPLLVAAGCQRCDPELAPLPLPDEQVDLFEQKDAARVDILWVVDDSGSMATKQARVAARFEPFFRRLLESRVDYHIGVITTDPQDRGALRAYPEEAPDVEGCDGCRFLTRAVACPDPVAEVPADATAAEAEAILLSSCPAAVVFRRLVLAGTQGSSFEEGFVQAAAALGVDVVDPTSGLAVDEPPAENAGFLREDASLYVVFVSDEDEGGKAEGTPVRYYERLFESLKESGDENLVSVSAIAGWPLDEGLPRADELCAILGTTFDADPSNDDPRASEVRAIMTRGDTGCVDAAGAAAPDEPQAFVETGGRYIELACRTGGVVANMCEADYASALDRLGADAAGLLRKFPLSRPDRLRAGRDCTPFTEDDRSVLLDCDGDGTVDAQRGDDVVCVTAVPLGIDEERVVTRPQWSWEPGTSSVRFEGAFVPAPGTTVSVRYGLLGPDETCVPR